LDVLFCERFFDAIRKRSPSLRNAE